jgi:hypothetical protein
MKYKNLKIISLFQLSMIGILLAVLFYSSLQNRRYQDLIDCIARDGEYCTDSARADFIGMGNDRLENDDFGVMVSSSGLTVETR